MLNAIKSDIPSNLKIVTGNALKKDAFNKCKQYLNENKPVAIINEGLLRYLTFEEKRIVAENIYEILSRYGGIWITSDVTPKKFIASQNEALKGFNNNVTTITSRNNLDNRFEDIEHVKEFFGEIGFEVAEIHKFSEVKNELYSINELNIIDEKIEQTLEDAINVVMKIKNNK